MHYRSPFIRPKVHPAMSYLASFRASRANSILQTLLRVLQFLSAIISLGLFSARLSKILRHARDEYTAADGAVEGILAAASLYSLVTTVLKVGIRRGNSGWLRWLLVLLDLLFVGAFIAVAVLTRPSGGPAGPGGGACRRLPQAAGRVLPSSVRDRMNCRLPWGSFILAIIST